MPPPRHDPWFAPLYRRIAVVAVCVGWLGLEAWGGEQIWSVIALAVTGYAAWSLLIAYEQPPES
jgi:hypothetical protein